MDAQNRGWSPASQPAGYGVQGSLGVPAYAASGGGYPPPPGNYGGGYPPPPPPPGQPPYGQPPYGQQPYGAPPPPPQPPSQGMPPNTAATVSYLTFIPALIFLLMDPYKRMNFVRFHAWQCILLTAVAVIFGIGIAIVSVLLSVLHLGILVLLLGLVHWLVMIVFFIFWLIAIIKANKGERYHIPLIGGFADKMAGNA